MVVKSYDICFCENKAKVMISKGAEILSVGVRKKFEFGRFYEVPFLVVKQEEEKETEEISLSLFSVTEPIEVKAWQYYLGTIALDNGTSTYIVIAG